MVFWNAYNLYYQVGEKAVLDKVSQFDAEIISLTK